MALVLRGNCHLKKSKKQAILILMKDQHQKIFPPAATIILFFVALFLYARLAGPIPFAVNSVTTTKTDTFSVSGEGKAIVKPDIALVNAGVEANGATVKQVQDEINKTTNKVTEALKDLGVDEKDIKTVNYSIHPNYDWSSGRQRITGYRASTSLQIKVHNIDNLNQVIDKATASGANNVGNISFDVDDKTKAEEEARKEAVAEAKKKAKQAAEIAGFKLGRIINYSESKNGGEIPIVYREALKLPADAGAEPTEIQPGSSEIKITVTLSYELQ